MTTSLFRDQDIRMLPRLLENLLLRYDQNSIQQFIVENCNSDCVYELQLHYGDDTALSADPSAPTSPARKSFTFNNSNIAKLLEHIHVAIPDGVFLIHDSQFLTTKVPRGMQIVSKFSFTGFAIFDSDMDVQALSNFDQGPSPRHLQQLLQVVSSMDNSDTISSGIPPPPPEYASKKTINFMGDMTSHSSAENTKRKFSNTVGKYVDSKHLDTAYEVVKKTKESGMKSRKSPSNHSHISITSETADQDSTRIRSMSLDTIETVYSPRAARMNLSSVSDVTATQSQDTTQDNTAVNHNDSMSSLFGYRAPIPPIVIPKNDSIQSHQNLESTSESANPLMTLSMEDIMQPASPLPMNFSKTGKSNSSSNFSLSHDSSVSDGTIPSIFMTAPRKVQSGGVLKIWLPDDDKKISSITVIAYCSNSPS